MAKKKKGNQRQQQKSGASKQKQQIVTQKTYTDAKEALEDSSSALESVPEGEVNVAEIVAAYTTDGSVTPEDVAKCVADLKKAIYVHRATQQKYEELKSQLTEDKKSWEKEKSDEKAELEKAQKTAKDDADKIRKDAEDEVEKKKEELKTKREELNIRELKLVEDEEALKEGDHSGVIDRLINAFKHSKEQVVAAAETYLQQQSSITEDYITKHEAVRAKETQLEKKERELNSREKKVKALELLLDEERETMRRDVRRELEDEYEDRLKAANNESTRYQNKLGKANQEAEDLRKDLEIIRSAFGDQEPVEMAGVCLRLEGEIKDLQQELASRPLLDDLTAKQREVEYLEEQIRTLRGKFNELEYDKLRAMFENNDELIRDKQLLVDKVESYKARILNYQDTIEDLRRTISEFTENHNKDNAFKASSKYDMGDYQIPLMMGSAPAGLPEFISYLQSFMAYQDEEKERRYYSKDTIKKFIAGLHMSPITILQGISGTGKTSLPRAVAMAMMADDKRYNDEKGDDELTKSPYRICPIQSGWRDKMDLLGFYNSFEKSYHETEFFNALYLANQPKYEHTLFFIVLDEMNLSRPEHYFADFLSKLELTSEKQRKIKIDNVPDSICPNSIVGGSLPIPRNVRFIGTANHDETTLEFAPKTYDRSNVIDMPRNAPKDEIPNYSKRYNVTYTWLSERFTEAESNHHDEYELFEGFIKDENLLELLAKHDIGIGNRFEGQAKRFISVFVDAGEDAMEDLAKAADHLMTTRILRTLKDNYDLDYDPLDRFKTDYVAIFSKHFYTEPKETIELIDRELGKKKK